MDVYPNLVVLQTFSKAWGLAGIRLGMAFASKEIIDLFNKVKPPYNVNELTQMQAAKVLEEDHGEVENMVDLIISERIRVKDSISGLPDTVKVYPSSANFLLVKFKHPKEIFLALRNAGVIVRDRTSTPRCEDCLRITIGTIAENDRLLSLLKNMKF